MSNNTTTTVATVNQTSTLTQIREAESNDKALSIVLENRTGFDVHSLDSAEKISTAEALLRTERQRQANFEEATRTLAFVMIEERGADADATARALLGMKSKPREKDGQGNTTPAWREMKAAAQSLRRASATERFIIPFVEKNGAEALTDEVKTALKKVANSPIASSKDKQAAIVKGIEKTGKVPTLPKKVVSKTTTSRSGKVLTPADRRGKVNDAIATLTDALTALLPKDLDAAQKRDLLSKVTAIQKQVNAYKV